MSCCDLTQRFPCRYDVEENLLEFDYGPIIDEFEPGVKVDNIKPPQVVVLAGDADTPMDLVVGTPAMDDSGRVVILPVSGGQGGVTYMFVMRVVLTNGLPAAIFGYSTTLGVPE